MATQFARETIEIKTPRVVIRTLTPDDAPAFRDYCVEPANYPYGGTESDMTLEKMTKRVASFAQWQAEGKHAWIAMVSRETGEFMGYGGYNGMSTVRPRQFLAGPDAAEDAADGEETKVMVDMGIMLDHKYWEKGLGLEIFIGLMEFARREWKAELFRTETDLDNEMWQRLMRAVGVGACVTKEKASYDANKQVLQWRWDDKKWLEAKKELQGKGKWIDIE